MFIVPVAVNDGALTDGAQLLTDGALTDGAQLTVSHSDNIFSNGKSFCPFTSAQSIINGNPDSILL